MVLTSVINRNSGLFSKSLNSRDFFSAFQDVLKYFLNKLQEDNVSSEQSIVVSSAHHELRNKQQFFEKCELDKVDKPNNALHWPLRDIAQLIASEFTFLPI